jgi:hypothetical protein
MSKRAVVVENKKRLLKSLTTRAFEYCRVGHDQRRMTFRPDGRVGEGAAGREIFWRLKTKAGGWVLEILSETEVTCRLKQDWSGIWRGRWLACEKMPIALSPLTGAGHSRREVLEIVAVIAVRNEEKYLPGYFKHLREFVDGFIVFDDCSTDGTAALVRAEPKLLAFQRRIEPGPTHYFEAPNREFLLNKAHELAASWVLCCDADERFERRFLSNLRGLLKPSKPVMALRLRALWGKPDQYRVDGLYADRHKYVLFPCVRPQNYYGPGSLHSPWYPPSLNDANRKRILDYNLYHLKSIAAADRRQRYEKFKAIDPECKAQAEGYEHLIDGRHAVFRRVPRARRYEL